MTELDETYTVAMALYVITFNTKIISVFEERKNFYTKNGLNFVIQMFTFFDLKIFSWTQNSMKLIQYQEHHAILL